MFQPGEEVEISYPVSRHVRLWHRHQLRRRLLIVHDVRDLVAEPLSVSDFLRRPYLLRSRWLIRAFEPEHDRWRQFYIGSSQEFRAPGLLRVGLYERGAKRPSRVFGRPFEPTPEDRRALVKALRQWHRHDLGDVRLCVFADDLRLRA